MKYDEIQSKKEAFLKAVDQRFKDNLEQTGDLKKLINDWAELE
jgi:hypothetical protein